MCARAKVTHGLYHMTNADVGGLEYADITYAVSQVVLLTHKTLTQQCGEG